MDAEGCDGTVVMDAEGCGGTVAIATAVEEGPAHTDTSDSTTPVDSATPLHVESATPSINVEMKSETATEIGGEGGEKLAPAADDRPVETGAVSGEQAGAEQTDKQEGFDPYGYLKEDKFTSERFKIEIKNLPMGIKWMNLRQKIKQLGLKANKIKFQHNQGHCFITFNSDLDRDEGMKLVNGTVWKGFELEAKLAKPRADPVAKRKLEEESGTTGDKRRRIDPRVVIERNQLTQEEIFEQLEKNLLPLAHLPYEDQLKDKMSKVKTYVDKLSTMIGQCNNELKQYFKDQKKEHGLQIQCPPILPSPVLCGYRNKCEFSVGVSPDGREEKVVGARLGRYKDGFNGVVNVDKLSHVPQAMKIIAKDFQEYIRLSPILAYNTSTHGGHWNQLTVKTTLQGHVMAIVSFYPQDLAQDVVAEEKGKLRDYFTSQSSSPLTSLYWETNIRGQGKTLEHLHGSKEIIEKIFDMEFLISPDSFFQVNTAAAEVLYWSIGDLCEQSDNTTVLDLCCGTGTIGMCLAKKVKRVIGIELCENAVKDAKRNAETNKVTNIEFLCGKVEDLISTTVDRVSRDENIVAVLDPPRGGAHGKVMKALRRCTNLKKIIYVSCNPDAAKQNIVSLCRPVSNNFREDAFRPVKVQPVDMFPHSDHYELVILLQR